MLTVSKTLQNDSHYAPTPSIWEFMKIYKLWDHSFEKKAADMLFWRGSKHLLHECHDSFQQYSY